LWQAGGDPLELDSPASRKALDFLAELAPHLDSQTKQAQFDTINQYLADGETALAPNWTFGVSEVVLEGQHDNIRIYPGWTGPASGAHVLGGDVLAIPKQAPRPKAALSLARYFMSKRVQQELADELFWPPVRTDVDHGSTPTLQPYWDAINEAMSAARPRPAIACWSDVERVLGEVWRRVVTERKDPTAEISAWATEIRSACEQQVPSTP
jgi:trehalose transport system substrate-binding protein